MKPVAAALLCVGFVFAQAPRQEATVAAPELHFKPADNLSDIKQQLVDYVRSGQYDREIVDVVKAAHDWVETRTASPKSGEKLAAIFDIDETSLSGLSEMAQCDFCSPSARSSIFPPGRLTAIKPVLDLYNFAKSKGVAMFFLTGRYETGREIATSNLTAAGYAGWTDILFRPNANSQTAALMKAGVRKTVEQKGYKIILNIGDQLSDLAGGYSERTYKLPDPFYFVE